MVFTVGSLEQPALTCQARDDAHPNPDPDLTLTLILTLTLTLTLTLALTLTLTLTLTLIRRGRRTARSSASSRQEGQRVSK